MSYTVNIPFDNISYYQANRQSARVVFDAYSYGSYTHWGSDAIPVRDNQGAITSWYSTVYDVAKIKFNLSNLGLPAKLPNGTVLQFTVKNISNWIGAGYLRGRVTQVNYETVTECFSAWPFAPMNNLVNATLGFCQSPNIWGNNMEGVTVTFTGTVNGIDTTQPVYLYIYDTVHNFGNPGSTTSYFQEDHMSFSLILPYTSVGQPSNGKMEINGTSITGSTPYETTRDTIINLSWGAAQDGSNNPVSGYKLYYGLSGETYSQSLLLGNVINYSFKISESFGGPRKGTIFHLGIQALATHENMNSEIVSLGYISVINKPPEPPTFKTSGIIQITTGKDTAITITNLSGKDIDDDSLTFYYALGDRPNLTIFQNEDVVPANKKINMNPQLSYLYIRAKETESLQSTPVASEWTCVKAIVNETPTFTFSYEVKSNHEAAARNGTNKKYADTLSNIKCVLSQTPATIAKYDWQIGTEDNKYDISINSSVNFISSQKINSKGIQEGGGKKIKIKLKITDSAGDSFTQEYLTNHFRLYEVAPKSVKIKPVEQASAKVAEKYINNFVKAEIGVDFELDDVFRTISLYRGQQNETGEWIYSLITSKINVNQVGVNDYGPFETKVQYDQEYRFKIGLSDPFNNTKFIESGSYWKLGLFNIPQSTFSFSKTEWHPLKEYQDNAQSKVSFTSLFADNIGDIGKNSYTLEAVYENKTYLLASRIENEKIESGWNIVINGSTIIFQINGLELFKKLKRATNTSQISITYNITGYNAFGEPGITVSFNGTIITQEKPKLQNLSAAAVINNGALPKYKDWFNPQDEIIITLTGQAFDYNDLYIDKDGKESYTKSITKYIIYYKYKNKQEWNLPGKDWNGWQGDFIKDNHYISEIVLGSMPSLALNEEPTEITLGIQLLDDTGLAAEGAQINYLTLDLVACRKENVVLSINEAKLNDKLLEISLQTNDFGGNQKLFENFCRSGEEQFNIVLYVSRDNETFEEYVAQIPYSEGFADITVFNKYLSSNMFPYASLKNGEETSERLYIKVKLEITTNSQSENKISSISATYLLYLSIPTMSQRSHWIGINNSENEKEDVFQISSFENRKQVRLKGAYKDANDSVIDMEIIINLDSGIISTSNGMSINFRTGEIQNGQIDCGHW